VIRRYVFTAFINWLTNDLVRRVWRYQRGNENP